MKLKVIVIALFYVALSACVSNETMDDQNASADGLHVLDVTYTQRLPNGSTLREVPTEVTIVKRRNTRNNVAVQVGLNVILFALGGGVSIDPFSKDDLKGERIEPLDNRNNISNPIPTKFVGTLKDEVNRIVQSDAILKEKVSDKRLAVSSGSSRLIYEKLSGDDEEKFRLITELYIWAEQKGFHINLHAPERVVCSEISSDLLTQDQWADNDYELVKSHLDSLMQSCEQKVVAQLPSLLGG